MSSQDTQLLSEGLVFLDEYKAKLEAEARFMAPYGSHKLAELENLKIHLELVRARVTGLKIANRTPRFEGTAPLLLAEAPRVDDPGADVSAPTMGVGAMEDLFGKPIAPSTDGQPHHFDENGLPPWCTMAFLSHNKEERGRLLTFKFRGESHARVAWVRA